MATQQFKALNLREVFNRALHGQPINCHVNNLYDLDSLDIDEEVEIVDDSSDELQVLGYVINDIEEKHMSKFIESKIKDLDSKKSDSTSTDNQQINDSKGGIENEKTSKNEQTPPLPQK